MEAAPTTALYPAIVNKRLRIVDGYTTLDTNSRIESPAVSATAMRPVATGWVLKASYIRAW